MQLYVGEKKIEERQMGRKQKKNIGGERDKHEGKTGKATSIILMSKHCANLFFVVIVNIHNSPRRWVSKFLSHK